MTAPSNPEGGTAKRFMPGLRTERFFGFYTSDMMWGARPMRGPQCGHA